MIFGRSKWASQWHKMYVVHQLKFVWNISNGIVAKTETIEDAPEFFFEEEKLVLTIMSINFSLAKHSQNINFASLSAADDERIFKLAHHTSVLEHLILIKTNRLSFLCVQAPMDANVLSPPSLQFFSWNG